MSIHPMLLRCIRLFYLFIRWLLPVLEILGTEEIMEKMSILLTRIKDLVQTHKPSLPSVADDNASTVPLIPDDFRCPISQELTKDPVMVSTGQNYEQACIEKWCEANPISKSSSVCTPAERAQVDTLVCRLASGNAQDHLSAAGQLRLLTKSNADALRICIAEAGAIPLLVDLLTTPDPRVQEQAVTALHNLSICEENKGSIVRSGAVPGILHVLKKGSMQAQENAAAALYSLSLVDENKVTIGSSGAIPALVTLLSEGSPRGKKDAASALFHLCMYQGNKGRVVRAGVVPTLMRLLTEPEGGMVDESLAILAIIATHSEGITAIGIAEAVPALVEVIRSGSPMNKDNAAAVLVQLCSADQQYLADAQELGLMGPLLDMAQNGSDGGKQKAGQLLECLNRFIEQQKQIQMIMEVQLELKCPDLLIPKLPFTKKIKEE